MEWGEGQVRWMTDSLRIRSVQNRKPNFPLKNQESGSDGAAQAWLDKILAILFMRKGPYRLLSTAYGTSGQRARVEQRRKCYILTFPVFKVGLFTIPVCMDVLSVCVSMHHEHA